MFSVVKSSMYYPYILCFVFLYWVSVAWQAFERKMEKEVGRVTVADPGQRPGEWGRPPLILRPNWGPRAENKIFADRAPPPPPPLLPYLQVWIGHCMRTQNTNAAFPPPLRPLRVLAGLFFSPPFRTSAANMKICSLYSVNLLLTV